LVTGEEIELPPAGLPFPDYPNISGDLVVYETMDELPPNGYWGDKIVTFDLSSREVFTVAASVGVFMDFPDISGDTVVWMQMPDDYPDPPDFDILGYDLASQTPFTVSDRPGNELWPRIDGDIVVWQWQGNIYGYDLASGERLTITEAAGTQDWPAISGDLVVWTDDRYGVTQTFGKFLSTGEEVFISEGSGYTTNQPSVWGNVVAWDRGLDGAGGARRMTDFAWLPVVGVPDD
jgi:beta propeller repeat protein